ncbi:MAG TPA: hypothetical protein VJX66_03220 [Amycolatopsis sp.]|nr:hypothetical protein [Amycolatopsis sp.]
MSALPRRVVAVCAVAMLLIGMAGAADASPRHGYYATKTPYQQRQDARTYEPAPRGFKPIFTQLVTRHGSRGLSDADDITFLEQVIATAGPNVTKLGAQLLPALQSLDAANKKLGYGNLSSLGRQEQTDLATRLAHRLPALFEDAVVGGRHVSVLDAGVQRDVDSESEFVTSLENAVPRLSPLVGAPVTDKKLLYFHKSDPDYVKWSKSDPALLAKLKEITYSETSLRTAVKCLNRLFSADFVRQLGQSAVDVVLALYAVYSIEPGLSGEGSWHFERFLPEGVARHFAYVDDADSFYSKGPSFAGTTITFKMAKVLEDDFFKAVTSAANGGTDVARLRFTHAEEILPLAALMHLPGSDQQASATYTYWNNDFRGARVAPMSANIQWDVYRDASGTLLVKMLYNEKETAFQPTCRPYRPGSNFYTFTELKRCYGY